MQPITREAIIDRRQAHVRWSAVIAGALVAGGLWLLFQLLFTGGALAAVDPEEVDHVKMFGIGASVGSMLAPLLAMFAGGLVAGRLAGHYDSKVLGLHGGLVWALASVFGLLITMNVLAQLASRPAVTAHAGMATAPAHGASHFIDQQVDAVNAQLKAANAPQITKDDIVDASRYATTPSGTIDRSAFIARLDEKTQLSRPEAEAAVTALGERAPDVIAHGNRLAEHRQDALEAVEDSGKAMLGAGIALLLCLAAAVAGAILGRRLLRRFGQPRGREVVDDTTTVQHTTAPYPAASAPSDRTSGPT